MMPKPSNQDVVHGQSHGVDTLIAQLYKELRRMARARFHGERSDHTLQPTAVVHEAYLRLKRADRRWNSETEFRKYAAPVIRHVLVDYARERPANTRITITSWDAFDAADDLPQDVEVLAVHEVLDRLEKHDRRLVRIVELRYFGGLTEEETAQAVGMPLGTLKNQLTFARTWLRREFTKSPKQ